MLYPRAPSARPIRKNASAKRASVRIAHAQQAMSGTSVSTQGPSLAAPIWLRLTRQASTIKAWYRKNATDAWTQLDSQVIGNLNGPVDVGLATTGWLTRLAGAFAIVVFILLMIQVYSPQGSRLPGPGPWLVLEDAEGAWAVHVGHHYVQEDGVRLRAEREGCTGSAAVRDRHDPVLR